jgi:hypothetical protein
MATPTYKKKYESLVSMVESDLFTIEMLIHQLKDHYEIDGVREVLISKLYKYPQHQTLFYVPELWYPLFSSNLYLCNPRPALKKFLIDKGSASLHFYLLVQSLDLDLLVHRLLGKPCQKEEQDQSRDRGGLSGRMREQDGESA